MSAGGVSIPLATPAALELRGADIAKPSSIRFRGSDDLRTCLEVAVVSTNIVLRPVLLGVAGSTLASGAHGISSGNPYTIEARITGNLVEVSKDGFAHVLFSYDISAQPYPAFTAYGFASSTNGAKVLSFKQFDITRTYVPAAEILWAVADTNLDVWIDGENQATIGTGLFPAGEPVFGDDFDQTVRLVGGGKAYILDTTTMTIEPYVPTYGTLPGQTEDGTTDAVTVRTYGGRVLLPEKQNILGSAIGDGDDFDTGRDIDGRAFDLSATKTSKIGDPVVGLFDTTRQSLLILTTGSAWVMRGDPALSAEIIRLGEGYGYTSQAGIVLTDNGIVAHSTVGLVVFPDYGTPAPLSQSVLTQYLSGVSLNSRRVSMVRDAQASLLYVFLTDPAGGQQRHIVYDERIGQYQIPPKGLGAGYFIDLYPERVGPMAACLYMGEPLMLGRDGYVRRFDPAATSDDGDPIECIAAFLFLNDPDVRPCVQTTSAHITLGSGSGPVQFRLFGGISPEDAYGDSRFQLYAQTLQNTRNELYVSVTAPCLVGEFYSNSTSSRWRFEGGIVEYMPGTMGLWAGRTAATPAAPANSAAVAVVDPPAIAAGPGAGSGTTDGQGEHWSEGAP